MTWTDAPFKSILDAHKAALKFELNPSSIVTKGDYDTFTVTEGRSVFIMAQHTSGGVVREREFPKRGKGRYKPKQEGPYFGDENRMQVGPWVRSDHATLKDVEAYYRRTFVNFDNVEVISVVLYRIDTDEYEYCKDSQGIWCRVLHRKGK